MDLKRTKRRIKYRKWFEFKDSIEKYHCHYSIPKGFDYIPAYNYENSWQLHDIDDIIKRFDIERLQDELKKMDTQKNRKLWYKALRSKKYKQCKNGLGRKTKHAIYYDVLGVACLVAAKKGIVKLNIDEKNDISFDDEWTKLPFKVQKWLGATSADPLNISRLNDKGKAFTTLANILEDLEEKWAIDN